MNTVKTKDNKTIKSPLNYIGGKQKILNQILPLFPQSINQFIDLFAGGCNVGINTTAKKIYFNDNLIYLIEMYKEFYKLDFQTIIQHVQSRISEYELSLTNEDGFKKLRAFYNSTKNPLDLFLLISFSFNHQIRFNNNHEFNNPFGRERSSFNATMKYNLEMFHKRLKLNNIEFTCQSFEEFDFTILSENDFVYADPPYLITTGSYNDGKRGFKGWTEKEELELLKTLDSLNHQKIKFALSNVLEHKGKSNEILKNWLISNPNYKTNYININYSNSNYHTINRDKKASIEVLITNYEPIKPQQEAKTLFDNLN
jgi:DNA adenine methylase